MSLGAVELIDTPVVSLIHLKRIKLVICASLRKPSDSVVHIVEVITEIYCMYFHTETTCPAKVFVRIDEFGAIGRGGIVCGFRRNRETPDLTFPRTVRIGIVNLIDTPVVCRSRHKAIGKCESGKAGHVKCYSLIASEYLAVVHRVVHRIEILTQIHVVRDGKIARSPRKAHPRILVQGAIPRVRTLGERLAAGDCRQTIVHYCFDIFRRKNDIKIAHLVNASIKVVRWTASTRLSANYKRQILIKHNTCRCVSS